MDDIVKRLRDAARRKWPGEPDQRHSFFGQAADEIEALRDRIDYLTASGVHTCETHCQRPMCVIRREKDAAEAALKEARILLTTARLFIPDGLKKRRNIDAFLFRDSKEPQP